MAEPASIFQRLFSLHGKTALITGASGGIGTVLATALAEAGATIGVHGRTLEKVAEACEQVTAMGGQAFAFSADLSETAANRQLIDKATGVLGRLDILINCAAMNRRKPIADVTADDYDTIMALNLRSVYFLCQAAHIHMRAGGGGKIINISSANERYGLGTVSVYGASKAGLAQVSRVMAVEWAQYNIQVNCIVPGFMMTPLTAQPLWGDKQRNQWLRDRIPLRRPGEPQELVGATLLLASDASSYMTGSTIVVDGGFFAGGSWETDGGA
ncbi:MAG: glucose 1-dehydrogenase [Chloroflexota bacterium]|nr:glucose 1-dehydrogenase [Chloroflexota bacterium]